MRHGFEPQSRRCYYYRCVSYAHIDLAINLGCSGQQTSVLPEGQGHVVNMRLVLVVEQVIVGEPGNI